MRRSMRAPTCAPRTTLPASASTRRSTAFRVRGACRPRWRARVRPWGWVHQPPVTGSIFRPDAYEAIVERAKEYIRAGDVIQVVLAQRFECARRADPINIYRCLRTFHPSPYMFFLRVGPRTVLGASPEVMVRLEGRALTRRP